MEKNELGRVVVTGASGLLGRCLVPELLSQGFDVVATDRRRDRRSVAPKQHTLDLSDARLSAILEGAGAVVHLAGSSLPTSPWPPVLHDNIVGTYSLYEAARLTQVSRIILASSNRVTEGYEDLPGWRPAAPTRRGRVRSPFPLSSISPPRPLNLYAASKLFGEAMGRLYFEEHRVETLCLRIGSVTSVDRPIAARHQITWLSKRDFCSLVLAALRTGDFGGYTILYAGSRNSRAVWDIDAAERLLGWTPLDHASEQEPGSRAPVRRSASPRKKER